MHDEGVVVLSQKGALALDLGRDAAVRLPDPLQGVPHARAPVLHEPHHAGAADADHFDVLEVPQGHRRVLEFDALLQLFLHVALHNLGEGGLLHGPYLRLAARDLDTGGARLVEKEGPLAKAGVLAQVPFVGAVDEDLQLAAGDHEERRAYVALLDDELALAVLAHRERLHEPAGLLLGQVLEDGDFLDDVHSSGVIYCLLRIVGGGQPELLQGGRIALLLKYPEPAAVVAGSLLGWPRATPCPLDFVLLVPLPARHGDLLTVARAGELALDDEHEAQPRVDLLAGPELLDRHGRHDGLLLRVGELRHDWRLLDPRQQEDSLEARPQVAAEHLLQVPVADADNLALAVSDDRTAIGLGVHKCVVADHS
mmetsp:Transcript_42432/g.120026  ORF Transcript_42432/g.120026 Transcript_42432/m.120026 type:complete len:368 (-) Transcript_42432:875-1978(-)